MLATLAEELPRGDDWLFEVKWDGYRAVAVHARRRGRARLAQRQRPDERFAAVARGARKALRDAERRARRRGVRARRAGPRRASRHAAGRPARSSTTPSTCSRLDGEPLVDLPLARAPGAARALLDGRSRAVRLSEAFDDGEALLAAAAAAGPRGHRGEARRLAVPSGPAHARLAEGQDGTAARSSSSPATRGARPARGRFGSLVLAVNEAASCAGSATSARASATPRSTGC